MLQGTSSRLPLRHGAATRRVTVLLAVLALLGAGLGAAQNAPRITASGARQIQVLKGLNTSRSPEQSKIGSRLFHRAISAGLSMAQESETVFQGRRQL